MKQSGRDWKGNDCKTTDFTDRKKLVATSEELEIVQKISLTKIESIPDIEDGEKYEWVQLPGDKYGRSMYCLKTGIRRGNTMGEFYGSGIVD
jgi:hypothetical protein